MKNTIKMTVLSLIAAFSVFTSNAGTNDSLFHAKEFGLSLGTGYALDTSAAFQQDYDFNLNAGVFYFPYKYFGGEVNIPFYQTKGASVSEVQAGLLARVPIGFVSPYVGVGGVYSWENDKEWAYIAKGGVEIRANSKWSVFAEYQYKNVDFTWSKGFSSVVGGIKFIF